MPEIPEYLIDPEQLARAVYDYWVSLLRTDQVEGAEDIGEWDGIDEAYREDFVESIRTNVTDQLRKFAEELQFESKLDQAFQETNTPGPPCYICGRNTVSGPGNACGPCSYSYFRG